MLRDLELMSRRQLLRRGGTLVAGASAASILFKAGIPLHASAQEETPPLPEYDGIPENLKGSGEVRVQSWGGAFQDAQREAYFMPFQELSGITVIESEGPDPPRSRRWSIPATSSRTSSRRTAPTSSSSKRRATTGRRSTTPSSTSRTSTRAVATSTRSTCSPMRRSSATAMTSSPRARRARRTSGTRRRSLDRARPPRERAA